MRKQRLNEVLEICLTLVFAGQETVDSALAQYPEYAEELRPKLETALWLHQKQAATAPRPGYIAASRKRLVAQIKQEAAVPEPAGLKKLFLGWDRSAMRLALVTLFLFISVFSIQAGVRVVNSSLPGDHLYSWKLANEKVQLALAPDEFAEAELQIQFADQRAREIEALLAQGRFSEAEFALSTYRDQLNLASDFVTNLDGDLTRKAELAQTLTVTIFDHNLVFNSFTAVADLPGSTILLVKSTITLTDNVTTVMLTVIDDGGQDPLPGVAPLAPSETVASVGPGETATPVSTEGVSGPTKTPRPTKTEKPTNTPKSTDVDPPTKTPAPTKTDKPTKTPKPTDPPAPTKTDKPTKTPKPTKPPVPTKTDKPPQNTPKPTKTDKPPQNTPKPTKTPKK